MATSDAAPASADDRQIETARRAIDRRLASLFPDLLETDLVTRAMTRAVVSPGKRLRPLMVVLGVRDLGSEDTAAVDAGCAIELVHAASLVLDDLPCMDDSDLRRGQPAVHRAFGEDVAVLASIALLAKAYGVLAEAPGLSGDQRAALVAILSAAIGTEGLVGGQLDDLRGAAETGPGRAASVMERKTAALFVAALEMACVLANGSADCRGRFLRFGRELGLAFQILDDLIDLDGCQDAGKPTGRDGDKSNLVRLIGPEASAARLGRHVEAAIRAVAGLPGGAPRLTRLVRGMMRNASPAPRAAPVAERVAAGGMT